MLVIYILTTHPHWFLISIWSQIANHIFFKNTLNSFLICLNIFKITILPFNQNGRIKRYFISKFISGNFTRFKNLVNRFRIVKLNIRIHMTASGMDFYRINCLIVLFTLAVITSYHCIFIMHVC